MRAFGASVTRVGKFVGGRVALGVRLATGRSFAAETSASSTAE